MMSRSQKILNMLNIPKYDTTKGVDLSSISVATMENMQAEILYSIEDAVIEFKPDQSDTFLTSTEVKNDSKISSSSDKSFSDFKSSGSEYEPSQTSGSIVWSTPENSPLPENSTTSKILNKLPKTEKNKRDHNKNKMLPSNRKMIQNSGSDESTILSSINEVTDTEDTPVNVMSMASYSAVELSDYETTNQIKIYSSLQINGRRIRNKGHSCYFCHKIILSPARHFETMHAKESDVAKLLAMPKNSKQRRDGFITLIRVGDFYHNTEVLSLKEGELILIRRPTTDEQKSLTPNNFGPCPQCLGFMLKKHLWHHIKFGCTVKAKKHIEQKHIISDSNALLYSTFGSDFSSEFIENVPSKLRDDEVGIYCREDNLILKFGSMQFEKYGTSQNELIRQTMRQLSRITLKIREIENSKKGLFDFLIPQKFDSIVSATRLLCNSYSNVGNRPEFGTPSLALKIGYALKKCAGIKRGMCLRSGNLAGNETIKNFLNLMDLEWNTKISANAVATMYRRKINATQLLPLTSDLILLGNHINNLMVSARQALLNSPSLPKWTSLASLALGKIILFNKRRSGEAARMTVSDYSSRPMWSDQCTEELKNSLTQFEKGLASKMAVVEIMGKRGRKVPVLLTQDLQLSLDVLVENRALAHISAENPYMFARAGSLNTYMRGHDCLRKICGDAQLKQPENVTSTKLRKYIATVCQVLNLSENEYDWLARHLGHDIRVHREFYRLHESAVELTKVSRLLIAADKGKLSTFAGRKLQDIDIDEIPQIDEEEDEVEDDEEIDNHGGSKKVTRTNRIELKDTSNIPKKTPKDLFPIQVAPRKPEPKSSSSRRRPWSLAEKDAVLKCFKTLIKNNIIPGKIECAKCIAENEVLSSRSWTDVKFCVKNHLDKINRQKKT